MMRIGLDFRAVTAAPHSGVARQAQALRDALRQGKGTTVLPFTAAPADHPHRREAICPDRHSLLSGLHRPSERWRFERQFLPRALSAHAIDLYVATVNMGLPVGLSARQKRRTRWVLQLHDVFQLTLRNRHESAWREKAYRLIDAWSIRHATRLADAIWVPSDHTANALLSVLPATAGRIRVLPNAVPFEPWQQPHPVVPAPARYWLLVGTREPRKNIAWFVDAWSAARRHSPHSVPDLVLIGSPQDLPDAPDGVRFVQNIDDAQLRGWYRQAERLWHPSYAEGFGLPVIEAAACGVPVATATGSALDEVTPPGSPRFDPRDSQALTKLMLDLSKPRRHQADNAERLRQWAARYDLVPYARRVDELLSELR